MCQLQNHDISLGDNIEVTKMDDHSEQRFPICGKQKALRWYAKKLYD